MRNIVCLKKIRFVSTALVLTAGLFVDAQTKNKVQSIYREIGAPLSVTYTDGRVAQILRRETTDEFRVPIFLLENSCTQSVGLKCTFVLPFIRQSYAAVWKNHPTSIGQPLEYTHDKNLTFGNQIYITRTQNELYETILQRMKAAGGDSAKINAAQRDKNLGRLECEADITPALPASRTILFWDENFESSNTELAISEGFGARVNLFWRRYQNTKVNVQGNVMQMARFETDYGPSTNYYPTGLSYSMLMSFRDTNIDQPAKPYCTLKWTVDFSNYFTQLLRVLSGGGFQTFNPAGYTPAIYTNENINPFAQKPYQKETWESETMQ